MVAFVTGIGSLIHLYSISYMHDDENMQSFCLLKLVLYFYDNPVIGSNLLVLFIGWEGVDLLLLANWFLHKTKTLMMQQKKAFIMNRIGI
jgi:NADH-quinone oxidoreductase subunit L